jgi:hypothetical protein
LTWIVGTLVNVCVAIVAGEARDTVTLIIVHEIDASGAVFAGQRFAFINIWFGERRWKGWLRWTRERKRERKN